MTFSSVAIKKDSILFILSVKHVWWKEKIGMKFKITLSENIVEDEQKEV